MVNTAGWLRSYRPVTNPRLRLACFPHAGAGPTAYRRWIDLVPADVEVLSICYPGRQDRFGEPFATSVDSLAVGIGAALGSLADAPLALFGHSMGAVVAYETMLRLEMSYGIVPRHLFVSGCWAPNRVGDRDLELTDDELISHIRRLGNVHTELFESAELRELLLSALRADYRLLNAYRRDQIHRVAAPVVAYSGDVDPGCSPAQVAEWSAVTRHPFAVQVFTGDHFYLNAAAPELIQDILNRLDRRDALVPG